MLSGSHEKQTRQGQICVSILVQTFYSGEVLFCNRLKHHRKNLNPTGWRQWKISTSMYPASLFLSETEHHTAHSQTVALIIFSSADRCGHCLASIVVCLFGRRVYRGLHKHFGISSTTIQNARGVVQPGRGSCQRGHHSARPYAAAGQRGCHLHFDPFFISLKD